MHESLSSFYWISMKVARKEKEREWVTSFCLVITLSLQIPAIVVFAVRPVLLLFNFDNSSIRLLLSINIIVIIIIMIRDNTLLLSNFLPLLLLSHIKYRADFFFFFKEKRIAFEQNEKRAK